MKTLSMGLSVSSIKKVKKELEAYRDDLVKKTRTLAKELMKIGVNVSKARIGESPLGKYVSIKTDIEEEKAGCKAMIIATGEVLESGDYPPFSTILGIEFGAGIHYNSEENPKAPELGYGVGTFPGQTHARDPNGWWFWNDSEEKWVHSYGVKATMPMYEASMEIQEKIVETAKRVFGNGGGEMRGD